MRIFLLTEKVASVIFLDQPVGAGFSYSEGKRDELTGDVDTTNISVDFLRKVMNMFSVFCLVACVSARKVRSKKILAKSK